MKLSRILKIAPGVTALIGGGGKTTLMNTLSKELSSRGTVIICTSTKILEPEDIPLVTAEEDAIRDALKQHRVVCVGTRIAGGKLQSPNIGFEALKQLADFVIVEADGAHRLPIKAHADFEPVIPQNTDRVVLVIGADCFGQPIEEICHRPRLFARRAAVSEQEVITPAIAARVITREKLGDCVFINKIEDATALAQARALVDLIDLPVAAGSLFREEYLCLC